MNPSNGNGKGNFPHGTALKVGFGKEEANPAHGAPSGKKGVALALGTLTAILDGARADEVGLTGTARTPGPREVRKRVKGIKVQCILRVV